MVVLKLSLDISDNYWRKMWRTILTGNSMMPIYPGQSRFLPVLNWNLKRLIEIAVENHRQEVRASKSPGLNPMNPCSTCLPPMRDEEKRRVQAVESRPSSSRACRYPQKERDEPEMFNLFSQENNAMKPPRREDMTGERAWQRKQKWQE